MILSKKFNRFAWVNEYVRKVLPLRKTTLTQDILLCIMATLTASFIHFDSYMPFGNIFKALISVMLILCWLLMGFKNGYNKRIGFISFTVLYWALPQIGVFAFESMTIKNYSPLLDVTGWACSLAVKYPLNDLAVFFDVDIIPFTVSLTIFTIASFIIGRILVNSLDKEKE